MSWRQRSCPWSAFSVNMLDVLGFVLADEQAAVFQEKAERRERRNIPHVVGLLGRCHALLL